MKELKRKAEDFLYSDKPKAKAAAVLIALIGFAGVFVVGAMAPNIFQILGKRSRQGKKYNQRQIQNTFYYLKKKNLVEIVKEKDDKVLIKLTSKGREKLIEYSLDDMELKKPKIWDKKWRIVIFDIPDKHKKAREALRNKLKDLGFYQFQKSAWIHPYPCFEEIIFISSIFNIQKFVEILAVDEISNEIKLFRYFESELKDLI